MNTAIEKYFQIIIDELNFNHNTLTYVIQNYSIEALNLLYTENDTSSKESAENRFEEIALSSSTHIETAIFFYSAALAIRQSLTIFESFLDYCLDNKENLSPSTLHYLYGQFESIVFNTPHLSCTNAKIKIWRIFDYIASLYALSLKESLRPISERERNSKFVLVLTGQFLVFQHGPTKSASDRCQILMNNMGKNVLLINTAELVSSVGAIPFINSKQANYNDALIDSEVVEWKSCKIPFFQCENNMPNITTVQMLLSMIQEQKPAFVLSIGGGGIVTALASKLVPTLCIGMIPSDLSITGAQFQTLSHPLSDDDKILLQATGRTENSVITGIFGSSILSPTFQNTRENVGLPSETWLAAVVGGRLDSELTPDFWSMAEQAVARTGVEFVLIGVYNPENLKKVYASHPGLTDRIHYIGFVDNTLNYLDLCDLYINPIRRGGGTSCVEAMSLGIPVITTSYGDVAINAGESFQTDSYDTMVARLDKYIHEPKLYQEHSQLAKKRASTLLNAEASFVKVITDFQERAKCTLS